MHAVLAPLAGIYAVNFQLMQMAVADVAETDLTTRPGDDANSMHCVTGHIVSSRYFLANLMGIPENCPFGDRYARGADWKQVASDPTMDEILSACETITGKITACLEGMTDADLEAKSPQAFPNGDDTVRGAIAFLALHESYHVGQLAYIRKLQGYKSLVG